MALTLQYKTRGDRIRPMGTKRSQSGWHEQTGGRTVEKMLDSGRTTLVAKLSCSKCSEALAIRMGRAFLPDQVLDRKALDRGWQLDPAVCPTCRIAHRQKKRAKEEVVVEEAAVIEEPTTNDAEESKEDMGITIEPPTKSAPAVKATLTALRLLEEQFDPKTGKYAEGWNDEAVAEKSGLALAQVVAYRLEGFGELAAPSEVSKLNADMQALEHLFNEQVASFKTEMAALRARVTELSRSVRR